VPAAPAEVVDTNGAGDAFFAGFLDAHLRSADAAAALEAGARQAVVALASRQLHPTLEA
jgi:sugar/nucleoside kinase (ribokinase family)